MRVACTVAYTSWYHAQHAARHVMVPCTARWLTRHGTMPAMLACPARHGTMHSTVAYTSWYHVRHAGLPGTSWYHARHAGLHGTSWYHVRHAGLHGTSWYHVRHAGYTARHGGCTVADGPRPVPGGHVGAVGGVSAVALAGCADAHRLRSRPRPTWIRATRWRQPLPTRARGRWLAHGRRRASRLQ